MPSVDVSFAMNAGIQLAALERGPFEVECDISDEMPAMRSQHCYHHGLRQITFSERPIVDARRCNCAEENSTSSGGGDRASTRVAAHVMSFVDILRLSSTGDHDRRTCKDLTKTATHGLWHSDRGAV